MNCSNIAQYYNFDCIFNTKCSHGEQKRLISKKKKHNNSKLLSDSARIHLHPFVSHSWFLFKFPPPPVFPPSFSSMSLLFSVFTVVAQTHSLWALPEWVLHLSHWLLQPPSRFPQVLLSLALPPAFLLLLLHPPLCPSPRDTGPTPLARPYP